MLSNFTLLATIAAVTARALKVGVISDLHLNQAYNSLGGTDDNCVTEAANAVAAPLARFGCDPSEKMVTHMMQRFKDAFGDVDLILAPGDAVAHKVAPHHDEVESPDWDPVKMNLKESASILTSYFPDTMVLWSVGNNDGWHSQAPDESQKDAFFQYAYDLWITGHPGNASFASSV